MNRYITDEERDKLFKACVLVVLPHHRIYNSGVFMMALSYSRPVITSDLPTNRKILSHESFILLFESGQPNKLSDQIFFYQFLPYHYLRFFHNMLFLQHHS